MSFETSLAVVWSCGVVGPAFLVGGAVAAAFFLALRARSSFVLRLNTAVYLSQIDRLVTAGNLDRAQKLARAHDGPVARLLRVGLGALEASRLPGGVAAEDRQRVVRGELARRLPEIRAWALKGLVPARLLGLGAAALGASCLLAVSREGWPVIVGGLVVLALLLLGTFTQARRQERDLQAVVACLEALAKLEALGTA